MKTKKTQVNLQSSKITNFFSNDKTPISIEKESTRKNEQEVFYKKRASKSHNNRKCDNQKCVENKTELADKLKTIKAKRDQVTNALKIGIEILKKKSDKINYLKSQLHKSSGQSTTSELTHSRFKDNFPPDILAILRSIDGKTMSDSSFVLTCVRSLYKDNLDRLKNISVTGRICKNERKQKMSPQKQKVLKDIFEERLNALVSTGNEKLQRAKKINEHIKRAIFNANSKQSQLAVVNAEINSTSQIQ